MLKSERHIDFIDIHPNKEIFKYRQKQGKVVLRNFRVTDKYACIFETCSNRLYHSKSMLDILKIDKHWKKTVEAVVNVNFKLDRETDKLQTVINYNKSDYRTGYMLILNRDFSEDFIKPFWKLIDLYIREVDFDTKLNNFSDKNEKFKMLYHNYFSNTDKHEIEHDVQSRSKRVKTETESYGPPCPPDSLSIMNPIIEDGPAMPVLGYPIISPTLQGSMPQMALQGSMPPIGLQEIVNFVKEQTQISDPRLRRDSLNSSYGSDSSIMSQMLQISQMTPNLPRDPRLRRDSLNTSQGSNSSMMSHIPAAPTHSDSEEVSKLKREIIKLQHEKNKCYTDATNFKVEIKKYRAEMRRLSQKNDLLIGELTGLKTLYRQATIKKEEYLAENTKLKTFINKGLNK